MYICLHKYTCIYKYAHGHVLVTMSTRPSPPDRLMYKQFNRRARSGSWAGTTPTPSPSRSVFPDILPHIYIYIYAHPHTTQHPPNPLQTKQVHSNCFLSGTDVQTQLAWQRYTDSKDCPWLAIVVRFCLFLYVCMYIYIYNQQSTPNTHT